MAPQDSFIDEDDDCCPLCVEEFDLSDRNFRPCPCGYQVCQFCFNNIRTNMNGLCPACRRPYDDKTIEWKVVTHEEMQQFKANIQKNAKKKAEIRQKEAQKREVESLNRKHLSGLRVVQKNLVYVVGLSPGIREEEMLQTLRGEKYFGQYGNIVKIVVSKGSPKPETSQNGQASIGVYVTFANKQDAARCIAAVNGSQNGDRILRAQYGTTKYCSAYLRNEQCTNKSCMFLHEPGDNDDSYSRQDLSSINSVNTQRPLPNKASSSSSAQTAQLQAPIQQAQPVAAAVQPMTRDISNHGSESGDGSALPSSANWGNRVVQQRSRRGSLATSGVASSPAISHSAPVTTETAEEPPSNQEQGQQQPEVVNQAVGSEITSVTESPRPQQNAFLELLKSINSPVLSFPGPVTASELLDSYPPLFDIHGGEKRRLMREQQEEDRLHVEQESQTDLRSVTEPLDEEEPESGSLQLGGEPEDRDNGREGSQPQGFQRRPSSQLPIQRGSNGGPFGPSLGQSYTQNLGNLSSINGRALTPLQQQQLMLLKSGPQSGFMDQYPPGIGNSLNQGSALFQQQGHNRQSSRYNFANENSSTSSTVKPSANPKLMAQQSSMMPSAQNGNQFYGSSMPGPPPGLKSSGTPPIGGGMFGQSHAFGSSMGANSIFGGAQKDNNGDMLREMIRGRGGVGGNQVHDTGKREYMFPSFLNQYPSASSTPAPASGLLASLYGPQTGAFHDFGQKQKKKGKKHRHANTSSSGGGGLVDLADPSILQARMQHQHQSNAGVGQGLFGGQAQDEQSLPSLDEASFSVDALVADSAADDFPTPARAPFEFNSRPSTPSIPPGFGLSHAHPLPVVREDPIAKPPSRFQPNTLPFTPLRNTSSTFVPRVATPLANVSLPTTPQLGITTQAHTEVSPAQAKEDVKALASSTGLSKAIMTMPPVTHNPLQSEDFPALDSGKGQPPVPTTLSKSASSDKLSALASTSSKVAGASSPKTSKPAEKRTTPGILNISVPKSSIRVAVPETPSKTTVASSAFPPLPPSTTLQSPATRTPKNLRVIAKEKAETPIARSATPSSTSSMFPPFPLGRSLKAQERPSTPTSEIISDNASITSASMSRANSPPPSKVGSAPVRTTTKSMQKKQRRELQKEKEKELEATVVKAEPEPEIAPIMGRKKKQKKERTVTSAVGGSTPVGSRPPSPSPGETPREESSGANAEYKAQAGDSIEASPLTEKESNKPASKGKAKLQRPPSPEPVEIIAEPQNEIAEKPIPTPASVLQDLVSSGAILDAASIPVLRTPVGIINEKKRDKDNGGVNLQDTSHKLTITPEDRTALLSGLPVHKITEGPNRIMLTPNGDCVRNLTQEEEERYLKLQAQIAAEAGPTSFFSAKHHASHGFTLIGGRAVPNGPPPFFPICGNTATPLDPVSKIQRDEALSYINQYVLPSLSTNSQLEKALNANALDPDMLRSNDASSWASWGNDAAEVENLEGSYGSRSNSDGILATGLESMTAHFAVGREIDRGQPLGNVSLLSLTDAENAMQLARKETETLEKKLNSLLKKNRRLLLGTGH